MKYISLIIFAFLLFGCDKSENNDDNNSKTILEGTWEKPCGIYEPEGQDAFYEIVTVTFTKTTFTSLAQAFTDANCSNARAISSTAEVIGEYTIGDSVTTITGLQATIIDSHISQFNGEAFESNDYSIFYINENVVCFIWL